MNNKELADLLDLAYATTGSDDIGGHSIVARIRRRRAWALTCMAVVLSVVLGASALLLVAGGREDETQVATQPTPPSDAGVIDRITADGVELHGEVSADGTKAQGTATLGPDRTTLLAWVPSNAGSLSVTGTAFGKEEGSGVLMLIRAAVPSAASIRVRLAGGTTDEMVPVDGWAILAAQTSKLAGTAEVIGADGAVLASEPFFSSGVPLSSGDDEPETLFSRITDDALRVSAFVVPNSASFTGAFLVPELRRATESEYDPRLDFFVEGIEWCSAPAVDALRVLGRASGEGDIGTVVAVHVASNVATVRLVAGTDVLDEMTPVRGQAVLASANPSAATWTVEALASGGEVLASGPAIPPEGGSAC